MKLEPIETYSPVFAITIKPNKRNYYAPNCWNDIREGKYREYSIKIFDNYIDGAHSSTLIVLKKFGAWVKSKLKYTLDGERKELWSYAKR